MDRAADLESLAKSAGGDIIGHVKVTTGSEYLVHQSVGRGVVVTAHLSPYAVAALQYHCTQRLPADAIGVLGWVEIVRNLQELLLYAVGR